MGVVDAYKRAWSTMWDNVGILLGILILYVILAGVGAAFQFVLGPDPGATTFDPGQMLAGMGLSMAWNFLVVIPLGYGLFYAMLRATRGEDVEVGNLFEGFRVYGAAIGSALLAGILVAVGFMLLIIPGIYLLLRFIFVPLVVVDQRLGPVDAMKESWRRTKGKAWSLLGLVLLAYLAMIAGFIALLVGVLFAMIWIYLTIATYYDGLEAAPAAASAPEPAPETQPTGV